MERDHEFYNHKEIEHKWQGYWAEHHTFKTGTDASNRSFMLSTCSAEELDCVGRRSYTATDILSRNKRAQGYNVPSPNGVG